jgi:signal transduction histidine kinase
LLRFSLRTKILMAVLAGVIATDVLGTLVVNDRLLAGAQQEADAQALAQMTQVQDLYAERAATLAAESEAVSLYPAVMTALVGNNPTPLLQWSGSVSALQGIDVTVVDSSGRVVARGHAPDVVGDDLGPHLAGLRLALAGDKVSGTEAGDEIGVAVRGYAPVRQNGREGPVVGAVMIADPLGESLLARLQPNRFGANIAGLRIQADNSANSDVSQACNPPLESLSATCRFTLYAPDGAPSVTMALTVPLANVQRARDDAQRALWLVGGLVVIVGAVAAWLLARSLTNPVARLTDAASLIAGGAYDRPISIRSADEIGVLAKAFETMRQRVAAATGRLRDERDVLDAVLESTGDGILMLNQNGQSLVCNHRWKELVGGDGLEGAAAWQRLEGAGQQTLQDAAKAWLSDPEPINVAEFERSEPHFQRLRCYTAPVHQRDGTLIGRIVVLRDITRESEAERMRRAFVATVSHELRSPLTAIAGYTDTLLNSGPWDDDTEQQFLEIVAQSTAKLSGLVDNLLDAAKVEAGVLQVQTEPVRLERLVHQVVDHRRALATSHPLRIEIEAGLPLANADPQRIEQVLANLVDNAIKYSPDGGPITVTVCTRLDGLTVGVSDCGIGLTAEQREQLFQRFYRAETPLTRTTKGVGLGLFICRSLIEAHGGHIWVESQPGRGSTFWFTVPVLVTEAVA